MIDAEIGERFGGQVPQIVGGRRGPERAHSSWVSEDRRSPAARWGIVPGTLWVAGPKVRHPFGITHLCCRPGEVAARGPGGERARNKPGGRLGPGRQKRTVRP